MRGEQRVSTIQVRLDLRALFGRDTGREKRGIDTQL